MMESLRSTNGALVDLLERVLDKGLILRADLIITVAGVPLVAVNLQAAIAGMETMIENGMWSDWDAAQRQYAAQDWEKRRGEGMTLDRGEVVQRMVLCSALSDDGAIHTWRLGNLYITDRRVVLLRKDPPEVLLEIHHRDLAGLTYEVLLGEDRREGELILRTKEGDETRLRSSSSKMAIGMIQRAMAISAAEMREAARGDGHPPVERRPRPASGVALWQRRVDSDEQGRRRYRFHLGHLDIEGAKVRWKGEDVHEGDFTMDVGDIEVLSIAECGSWEMGDRSLTLNCGAQERILSGSAEDVARTAESLDRLFKWMANTTPPHPIVESGRGMTYRGLARDAMEGAEKVMVRASTATGPHGRLA